MRQGDATLATITTKVDSMVNGVRRLWQLIAVVGMLVFAGVAASAASAANAYPTIYVQYTMGCTFSIVNDAGQPVSAIPPGTYQVEVSTPIMFKLVNTLNQAPSDYTGCKGWVQFQLTGPGVNLFTTLTTGCDAVDTLGPVTFQPGASYTAQDLNLPSSHATLSITSSGAPVIPVAPNSTLPTTSMSSSDVVGSETKKASAPSFLGTLAASVSQTGKLALTFKGRAVATLAAGRYHVSVVDRSKTARFLVQQVGKSATTIANGAGSRVVPLTLSAGQWFFAPGATGAKTYFVVTG